jgi:hypothetical protein
MVPGQSVLSAVFRPALRTPRITRSLPIGHTLINQSRIRFGAPSLRAWESTITGEEQSGHIAAARNESILFFDSKEAYFSPSPSDRVWVGGG